MAPRKGSFKPSRGRFPPVLSHYWGSIFRRPLELHSNAPRAGGGFNSRKRLNENHNNAVVIFVVIFFSSVLRIMDRIEHHVLPQTSDPMAFRASFGSDFTMLSVTAAIIAQVAITALALPNLNQVHWTATAGFVISLVTGCMSVWCSTTTSRRLTSLESPEAIRDWLSKPASNNARLEFENDLQDRIDAADLSVSEEVDSIRSSISRFVEENKWKLPSFYSCTMLAAPSLLLNLSLPSFLLGLGIYLGTVWKKNLDPVAGSTASVAVMICYIICLSLACALFFGASGQKEAETDFLRRWMDNLQEKAETKNSGTDVEAGHREGKIGSTVVRDPVTPNVIQETGSVVQAGGK